MKDKVLETREVGTHAKRRRYETPKGERYTTFEIPVTVLRTLGWGKFMDALAQYGRGRMQRERSAATVGEVLARKGIKATAVAHELGITEARVRQIRKEIET